VTELTSTPEPGLTCQTAAQELLRAGLIDAALTDCIPLPGGTASRVAALTRPGRDPELVLKLNKPAQVEAEALFLRTYDASPLLPRLRFIDPSRRFLVCDFAPGVRIRYGRDGVDTPGAMLTLVREQLAHYAPADQSAQRRGAGTLSEFLEETAHSSPGPDKSIATQAAPVAWTDFLGDHVSYRHECLAEHLPGEDLTVAERLAREPRRTESSPLSLIHGDCGAHNFLFRPGSSRAELVGPLNAVIDPYPIVGYPIYDLAFAFVSWPNGLEPEAILPAAQALRDAGRWQPNGDLRRTLWEEVLIALYMRMGTCMVHHPKDLPAYLAAWPRWRALVA
jgi:hypothetical protein